MLSTAGHWAKDYIATAAANGIVNGYSATTFGPDDPITREQIAVMIVRAVIVKIRLSRVATFGILCLCDAAGRFFLLIVKFSRKSGVGYVITDNMNNSIYWILS
ncbi:S-layer homology domain-containing protein [Pelotomaculum isophthalicicum]|uniref:S-layer homology domain-containing protein n=1 Tax=Pelotomaculum isophthalicicum TaxID=342448 RepID=UPI003B84B76F